jgi:prevent-host-death family protein
MLVETDNLVPADEFRKELDKYVAAAREGCGPIAITQNSEVVGFFIGAEEYEALFGVAVKKLLAARADGPTITHEEAWARIREVTRRYSPKA